MVELSTLEFVTVVLVVLEPSDTVLASLYVDQLVTLKTAGLPELIILQIEAGQSVNVPSSFNERRILIDELKLSIRMTALTLSSGTVDRLTNTLVCVSRIASRRIRVRLIYGATVRLSVVFVPCPETSKMVPDGRMVKLAIVDMF